jgi:hypothetical protein
LASRSGSATSNGTIGSGGTVKGGGARASINTWGPLLIFNPIVKLFCELRWNYQRVRIEKLWSLQDFQCKLHESLWEAYAWMCRLIMVTQGVT